MVLNTQKGDETSKGLLALMYEYTVPWHSGDSRPAAYLWVGLHLTCESENQDTWPSFSFDIPPFIVFESHVSMLCFKLKI